MAIWGGAVESLVVNSNFWRDKRVLLTGHTGFKGSWVSLWLQSMNAEVRGLALEPPSMPNLFVEAKVESGMDSQICDIRNYEAVYRVVSEFKPEIVIHMAAQALVLYSYKNPVETYTTNVMGTVNILEAIRQVGTARVVINVTTDKCYENKEWVWGYREDEPMGGFDPYSSSKGCSELITSAFRHSYYKSLGIALASARAGNVIGGGDWGMNRLIPDVLRAVQENQCVTVRNPDAIRPWQHVLEPLSGYLILAEKMWFEPIAYSEGWNFGPRDEDSRSVNWVVEFLCKAWGGKVSWQHDVTLHHHEARYLKLDTSKARKKIPWTQTWTLVEALSKIVQWHKSWLQGEDARKLCLNQINDYTSRQQS